MKQKYNPYANDKRDIQGSIIALAGPKRDIESIKPNIDKMFEKVIIFNIPDDYGEFPDTTGYEADNYTEFVSDMEDSNLYPYMMKCIDAVDDYNSSRSTILEKLGYRDIEAILTAPKFGGKVWCVAGIIKAFPISKYLQ